MNKLFEFAGGSVQGTEHSRSRKNNQDAWGVLSETDLAVAAIYDGCGDPNSPQSEMGAILASQLIPQILAENARYALRNGPADIGDRWVWPQETPTFWELVRTDVLAEISVLARKLGRSKSRVITRNFLFTINGALIANGVSAFFTIGDGVQIVNGRRLSIPPYPNNAPPYISYGLVRTNFDNENLDLIKFNVRLLIPTLELESFLLGCDGAEELIEAQDRPLPDQSEPVGPISQFWENDAYFNGPDNVRRRLAKMNQEGQRIDWEERRVEKRHGLLHDDTTIVVGRRRKTEG